MLSDTVMKNLLSAAWKNSWRPNIGQFELFDIVSGEKGPRAQNVKKIKP